LREIRYSHWSQGLHLQRRREEMDRFDSVVKIVEILNEYLDSCAIKKNTMNMIQEVKSLVANLEDIEKEIDQKSNTAGIKHPLISSALKAFKKEYQENFSFMKDLSTYMEKNKDALDKIRSLSDSVVALEKVIKMMIRIDKRLSFIK
jgi:hypothetical protein